MSIFEAIKEKLTQKNIETINTEVNNSTTEVKQEQKVDVLKTIRNTLEVLRVYEEELKNGTAHPSIQQYPEDSEQSQLAHKILKDETESITNAITALQEANDKVTAHTLYDEVYHYENSQSDEI